MPGGLSGPAPKHVSVRARNNRSSTRATLVEREADDIEIPPLPSRYEMVNGKMTETAWHPLAIAWWNDIWPSPMASEWHDSDIYGLYAVLHLYDKFFRTPNEKTHAELRMARTPFGLTPLDRRRLEWVLENSKKAQRENRRAEEKAPAPAPTPKADEDIRLRVV